MCSSVLAHREDGVALRAQAVLFRAGHHSTTLEVALGRRRIPYVKYGGLRFVEAAHVKDLLALLRLLDNPWDEMAWFRVVRLLEGVGPATAARVLGQLGVRRGAETASDAGATSPLTTLLAAAPAVPEPAREDLNGLRAALGACSGAAPGTRRPVSSEATASAACTIGSRLRRSNMNSGDRHTTQVSFHDRPSSSRTGRYSIPFASSISTYALKRARSAWTARFTKRSPDAIFSIIPFGSNSIVTITRVRLSLS